MENENSMIATTPGGKSVLLRADGTWTFQSKPAGNAGAADKAFRKSSWGMHRDQVTATESIEEYEDGSDFLLYKGSIARFPCNIFYIFVNDVLVRGKIGFTVEHANSNQFLNDYEQMKEMLTKKYSHPNQDNEFWTNDLYKDEPEEWGTAVSRGDYVKFAKWDLPGTEISLTLSGDNYEIAFSIDYVSKELGHLESQLKEQQALDEL